MEGTQEPPQALSMPPCAPTLRADPPPHILLKRTSTGTDASCAAERTESSWTHDEETWVGLAASTTNWKRRRESGGVGMPEGGPTSSHARSGRRGRKSQIQGEAEGPNSLQWSGGQRRP